VRKVADAIHPEIQQFQHAEQDWFQKRLESNEIVCALPGFDRYPWREVIPFDRDEQRIERRFSRVCEKFRLLGLGFKTPVYPPYHFVCYRNIFSEKVILKETLKKMPPLWWEEKHYKRIPMSIIYANDINCRRQSVASRLICDPKFLEDRDTLRKSWENLADQRSKPAFPLQKTALVTANVEAGGELTDSNLRVFWEHFDRFCVVWDIDGMTTWNLPMVKGMRAFDHSHQNILNAETGIDEGIPTHFPLNSKDKDFGEHDRRNHREKTKAEGVDDFGKWKKYAHLLEIYHWQEVIRNRCPAKGTAVNLKTKTEDLLAMMMRHDQGDLRKLRQYLREFQEGRRTSLQNVR